MATHPRFLSSLMANHLRENPHLILCDCAIRALLAIYEFKNGSRITEKDFRRFLFSFVKYLRVAFSGWSARSKHRLIYLYCGFWLLILWWLNRSNVRFNFRLLLVLQVELLILLTLIVRLSSSDSLVESNIYSQIFKYFFNEDNQLSVSRSYELERDCSHLTSDSQRPEKRRRILVVEVEGEPVSGYETPIIESDNPFVPNRELSNDTAQTEDLFGLQEDLLTEIFKKLPAFHDFAFCSTVCRRWRSACLNLKWSLYPPHPWSIHFQDQNILNRLDNGRYVLERCEIDGRHYYGCVNGWILNIGSTNIHIVNHFSMTETNLPILNPVGYLPITKPSDWYSYIDKFVLFKVGEGDDFQFCAVALFGAKGFIAFTEPSGFQDWICIESDDIACCRDVVLFQEQFYALCGRGKLFLCVFDRYKPFVSLVSGQPAGSFGAYKYYLVKNVDHLIAVFQYGVKRFDPVTFSIYRFDGTFIREPIYLEGRALFISNGNSWTIDAAEVESCRTNSIYFVDDYWLLNNKDDHFIGVIDIANGTIEDFQFEMDKYPPNGVSPFSLTNNVGA